jgi:hypothetical protein
MCVRAENVKRPDVTRLSSAVWCVARYKPIGAIERQTGREHRGVQVSKDSIAPE